jgi:hypothetical protein
MSGWTEVYVVGALILILVVQLLVLAALHAVLRTVREGGGRRQGGADCIETLLHRVEANAAHFEALEDGGEAAASVTLDLTGAVITPDLEAAMDQARAAGQPGGGVQSGEKA